MQPLEVERLCRGIVPGEGNIELEPRGDGLLSETYRVTRAGAGYVLKVAAEHRPSIGFDPAWEAMVLESAAGAGLAPEMVYAGPDGSVLLARWIEGSTWTSQRALQSESSPRIAELLRRVHAVSVPAPPRRVSPAGWIELYGAELARRQQADHPALHAAASARVQQLSRLPCEPGVLCHSDLHAMNLIDQSGRLILLDWEYAHVADPLWDLAGWSANNDFDPQAQWNLLACYQGSAPAPEQWQRLRLIGWLYDYVCLLWSRLYLCLRREGGAAITERARVLDARLHLPAHYAA